MSFIHDLHCDFPRDILSYAKVHDFVSFIQLVGYDYREDCPDNATLYDAARDSIERFPYETLAQKQAKPKSRLDGFYIAIRCLVQCEAPSMEVEEVIQEFRKISPIPTDAGDLAEILFTPGKPSPPFFKEVLASLAYLFYVTYFYSGHAGSLYALGREASIPLTTAARYANLCARMDYLPPAVLRIADWHVYFARKNVGHLDPSLVRIRFGDMWRAYHDCCRRQEEQEHRRRRKVAKEPHAYRCAVHNCGIQATSKTALRRCSGNCPPEAKPHYCSVGCQTKHWLVHQFTCKKGLDCDPVTEDDGDPDWEDIATYRGDVQRQISRFLPVPSLWRDEDNAGELFVDIPHWSRWRKGEIVRLRSRTLNPAFMRLYKSVYPYLQEEDHGYVPLLQDPRHAQARYLRDRRPREFIRGQLKRKRPKHDA